MTDRQYLIYHLDDHRYAVNLFLVERVVRMVEILPLPQGNANVLGLINVQGRAIPVINTRQLFGLPGREPDLDDRLIILNPAGQTVALVVDAVNGVIACSETDIASAHIGLPNVTHIDGVINRDDAMILIQNVDQLV